MISMETWSTIRNLKKVNPTMGSRTIARLTGVSKNTVKKVLRDDGAPIDKNKGVKKINKNIEPFEGFIKESFLKKNLKASRILKDIQSKGYQSSTWALYSYISEYSHQKLLQTLCLSQIFTFIKIFVPRRY